MGAKFIASVCCALEGMDGWRHTVKPDGSHLWWARTPDFALGIVVWPDVAGSPLFTWKVKRLRDGNEVEGACSYVAGGTNEAVSMHCRWAALESKPPPSARKFTEALTEEVPF